MKTKYSFLAKIFICLIIFISCNSDKKKYTISSDIIIADSLIDKIKKLNNDEYFVLTKEIQLETNDESLIGKIKDILYLDKQNRIIILDQQSQNVVVFDCKGRYLNKIGCVGEGPFEYLSPRAISFSEENGLVAVYSRYESKIIFFRVDGAGVKEVSLLQLGMNFSVRNMNFIGKDLYLYNSENDANKGPDGNSYRIVKLKNGEEFAEGYFAEEETYDAFNDGGRIVKYGNKLLFNGIYNGEIYEINSRAKNVFSFVNFGKVFDAEEFADANNRIQVVEKHKKNGTIDFVRDFGRINNFLFLTKKNNKNLLIDSKGDIISNSITLNPKKIIPNEYDLETCSMFMDYRIYNNFVITAYNKKGTEFEQNPTILLFKLNI